MTNLTDQARAHIKRLSQESTRKHRTTIEMLTLLCEENERLRKALIESQYWDWLSAKDDNELHGRNYFDIPEMQDLWDIAQEQSE